MPHTMPRRAVVLAAGYGTRMLPLSRDLPKPMMPLWGKPMLQHVLEMLARWGVRDVLINMHHQPGEILEFARRAPVRELRIALSFEPEILGTGGALRRAEWFVRAGPFWMINADVAARLDPSPLLRAFESGERLAALWMHPERGPRTVEVRDGLVRDFACKHPGAPGTFTFCGLHLLSPRILKWIPDEGFAGIIEAYQRAMKDGETVAAACVPRSYWSDIGTPEQYLEAHRELRRSRRGSFAAISPGAHVARGARIENSVIWDGARVGPSARVRDAIVGRDTEVNGPVSRIAMRADRALEKPALDALKALGFDTARCTALPVGPRGSARAFTRVRQGRRSAMLVEYSLERAENAFYCAHARFLARLGIRAPAILLDRPGDRLAVLEDLGDATLADARPAEPAYRRVLEQIARLHDRGIAAAHRARLPTGRPFDAGLYRWEREYFAEQYLRTIPGVTAATVGLALRELSASSRILSREPVALIHRDLQSSNILITPRGPAFIDFQGMRPGAAAYDLASLLCDPYVSLAEPVQLRLLRHYNRRARHAVEESVFWHAAVQRLAQALGAFARLSRLRGMGAFAAHIRPGLLMMRRALDRTRHAPSLEGIVREALADSPERTRSPLTPR